VTVTTTATRPPRTLHVEHCMGTVFSIDVRDTGRWDDAIDEVVRWLHHVVAVFSTYRPDSDISRIRRGELGIEDADPLVSDVLAECVAMQATTTGYFTALWDGNLDPTGLVKGWAIERASELLRGHGSRHHAVNGGGDVQTAGTASRGEPWRVGISNPLDRTRLVAAVTGRDVAVATTGTSERGAHIRDPFTGAAVTELASVTVVGPRLTQVDCYATAAVAMGEAAIRWLDTRPDHEALIVTAEGAVRTTSGFVRVATGS
jgi:thiamine biosynthesis lipoprotein